MIDGAVKNALRAEPYADEMIRDTLGNLLVYKKGRARSGKSIMLAAHMDEVGMIIKSITDEGYLKFGFVGGADRRVAIGKRVFVGESRVPGVIGIKAYHLVSEEEEKSVPKTADLYIDIGAADRKEAEGAVRRGDFAVFGGDVKEFGGGYLKAKAIDDRVGCAVMIKLLEETPPVDCWFAFTVQEEVGTRGAFAAAFAVTPDIALVIEGTTAADSPAMPDYRQICRPGRGAVIPFMDGGTIYDRGLFELLRGIAEEKGIPWQTKEHIAGATDARAVQRTKEGVRVAGIAAAVRYIHSPSCVFRISDMGAMLDLAREFLRSFAAKTE